MSAITKQIAAVEFHVNARQANAALESMRQSAEDAREEMAQLQEQANKGVKTVTVGGKDMDITKRIRDLNATAKAFEQAAQSQIKGVKAWDELWQHAKMGNIEQLTGQQIKAGVNGAKRQYDRLILGDEEDRRKAAAIRDIIDQANIVLDKLKGDTDKVIQTLSDGGHVADEVLQREKKNLEDMLSLTEKFSPEWQDYNRQLQAITKGIEEQAAQEKRLRGELVDANDARREAAKLDEDVAQTAKKEHAAQQQKIDDAQKQMQQYQEQRRVHQEAAQKITDEITKQDRQIASQSQLVESIKRENHERTKKSNVLVQEADQADKTAAKAKRAADSSAKNVERFSDKLQKAKDDVAKLQEQLDKLGSGTETPKVDTSKIDALKKQIEGLKAEYKQLSSDWIKASLDREPHKMYASYEDFAKEAGKKKGYDFEMDENQYLEKMRKRQSDTFEFMTGDEVLHSPAYLRIKDVAAGHTEEDDLFGPKEAKDILDGQKAYTDACDKVTQAISRAHASLRKAFDDNLQPEQVQNIAKQLHKLQALYSQFMDLGYSSRLSFSSGGKNIVKDLFEGTGTDFDKEVAKAEAQIKRTLSTAEKQKYDYYDKNFEKERTEAKQKQDEIDKRQEQIKKDLANAERDLANAEKEHSAESAKSNSEREAVVVKLTKALDKQSKTEEDLKQKEKEAADAQELYNRANADAVVKHEALDKAKAEGNKKLQEESQKLSQLQGAREANVASLNQEKEAIKQKNEAVDAQAKIINDAQQTQAKSRQLSIESIEKSIALLKQENRVIGDETNPQWVENEKTIGRLNRRLEEMNANAAELRRQAGVYNYIRENISDTKKVSDDALRSMYNELQKTNGAGRVSTQVMRENKQAMREIRAEQERRVQKVLGGDLGRQNEIQIRNAIAGARELIQAYGTTSRRAQTLAAQIVNAEAHLKTVGVEGARAARREADAAQLAADKYKLMQDHMKNLGRISQSAFIETQKFWKEQLDGHTKGSSVYKEATRNLKALAAEQQRMATEQLQRNAKQLNRKDFSRLSEQELQSAIAAGKQLAQSMKPTDQAYKDLVNNIIRAEKYVKEFGLEGQRSARRTAEQMDAMNDRMSKLNKLSDGALEETRKFWQEMVTGTAKGSAELKEYEDHLAKVKQEESERRQLANEVSVQKLGGDLSKLSESEIRQAIEAGKQLIQTYATASPEAKNLAEQIVNAERHLKQYGVEAERAAAREAEAIQKAADERAKADQMMETQLQNASNLTDSALKAQEHYWQRLIDDPKTAASSLSQYKDNLEKVHLAQQSLTQDKGQAALDFFRNGTGDASAEQIKEQAENLKRYRDTLPTQSNADVILEINRYLAQTGQTAGSSAAQMMSLQDALDFGKQGLTGSFKGTNEQLRQAKQVLESTLATTAKGSDRYKEIREALAGIAVEEKRVGGVSKEIQKILDEPKGRSFNELKVAVEQGRKELNSMTRTTKEGQAAYDELAAKVKAADLEMKNLGNDSKGTQSSFEKAVSRLKTYVTLYMGTAVALQKMSGAVDDIMTLSDKMGEVRKTTGFSADEVNRLSDNLAKLDTRTPIQDLMSMAAAAGQLGLNTEEDVRGFTEAANMLHVALPELGEEGATEMMKVALATGEVDKIRKQMQDGTVEGSSATAVAMEKVASVIDRLRATTAAAAPPVADFVKRVGAVGAQSGITMDQVAALGATVDELGMGTEMAATAISRMIPAIKNHAFDIAQSIGVTPDTIRRLYDTGHAMDVIVMILKHIKENNMQNDPNSIEKLLGTGGMQEIMKELDQQGARAGIVFAGLSQHVVELQKNLRTANTAYQQGTAILNEYNTMNDDTAGKMERLKNQISKVFVTAKNSKAMGVIIDILRGLVSFITGNVNPALRVLSYLVKSVFIYWGILKIGLGEAIFIKAVDGAKELASGLKNLMSNTRAYMRYTALLSRAHDEEAKAAIRARMANEGLSKAMLTNIWTAAAAAAFYLVGTAIGKMSDKIEQAREEAAKVEEQEANMRAEQDQLGVSAKAVSDAYNNTLKQTLSDLQGSYAQLKSKWEELKTEQQKVRWIKDNQKAFKDLGLSINSVRDAENVFNNNTDSVVDAFQRRAKAAAYAAKLTALYKRQIDLLDKKRTNAKEIANDAVYGGRSAKAGQEITDPTYHSSRYGYVNSAGKWVFSQQGAALYSGKSAKGNPQNDKIDRDLGSVNADIKQTSEDLRTLDTEIHPNGSNGNGGAGSGGKGGTGGGGTDKNSPWGANPDAASTDWKKYNGKELVARRKQMNEFVLALQGDTDVESVLSEDPALMAAMKKGKVKKDADSVIAWYDQQRLAIQDVLHSRALTNTGNWKDPKVAHQRAKSISAMVKNDMSYYMDELDAYYTEQKSQIEDAQNSGLITEEEGWRRLLENDRIWRQRRAELQQLYAGKTKEVTRQEADNIYSIIAERTGDTADFIKVNIGKTNDLIHQAGLKNVSVERRILGDLDKGTEQDFLKMRTAVKKQLDAIEEIVSKERPFDGIVKNLRQNVEKMGIIYTDLDKQKEKLILSGKGNGSDEMKALNEQYAKERPNRLTFLLKESENAYQKTGDTLLSDMRANGFSSWADAITQSDDADKLKEALVAQLHTVYDSVQDAIKKEASEVKKQVDIAWNDTANTPLIGGKSMKNLYEAAANALGVEQQSVSRANSLIGAGAASERVADKLAIRQLQIQLNMQEHYYALVRKIGQQRIDDIKRQEEAARKAGDYAKAEELALDAKHAKMSLNLTLSEEETDLAKQRAEINARVEESQNRLYTSLKEWGSLLSSSMQSLFEASNTGAADYYNNLAKMRLTGEGSAGGTYVIIDNAGTKDAQAHYENLDGEDALKRQLEIEQQNAVADAWKKVMDDINKKISDQITDWMNAALQTQSIDANTAALEANTTALYATRPKNEGTAAPTAGKWEMGKDEDGNTLYPLQPTEEAESGDLSKWPRARHKRAGLSADGKYDAPAWQLSPLQQEDAEQHSTEAWTGFKEYGGGDETRQGASMLPGISDDQIASVGEQSQLLAQAQIDADDRMTQAKIENQNKVNSIALSGNNKQLKNTKSMFAAMVSSCNLYGAAYQAMSNDNLNTAQKFQMITLQGVGSMAMAGLEVLKSQMIADAASNSPGVLGKLWSQLGYWAAPVYAVFTGLLGGLMGLATSKISKSKSQIAQVTGASVSAGRLSTGMLTYATGNVNEFTDPSTLTPGQQYNVDAADGHTYRARYMGANPKTHLTNGPEFHLVGERGREAIIDANTTRQLQMDDTGIWKSIQTLYNGGSLRSVRRGGMKAFATGNIDELADGATAAEVSSDGTAPATSNTDLLAALQASLDRNTEVMQKAVEHGIKGVFNVYGKDGLIDSYDRGKKNANRYGERY